MKNLLAPVRAVWRLTRVAIHLAGGAATVACVYPLTARRAQLALKRRWSRQLLGMLAVRLRIDGACRGAMRVANHVSWLDVIAVNAALPSAFVAKEDVRAWPLVGWLCARTETVFIRRGSRRAAHATAGRVADLLAAGVDVAAFPEGTTSDGRAVLPFQGALLQGAIAAGAGIQPLALRYECRAGRRSDAAAFCGDTSLAQSLWRVATADGLTVRLRFLAVQPAAGGERRALAAGLRDCIGAALDEFEAVAAARQGYAPPVSEFQQQRQQPADDGQDGEDGKGDACIPAFPA